MKPARNQKSLATGASSRYFCGRTALPVTSAHPGGLCPCYAALRLNKFKHTAVQHPVSEEKENIYSMTESDFKLISAGVVSDDPADTFHIGGIIHFKPIGITFDFHHMAVSLQKWHTFEGILLSLHFREGGFQRVDGSAVMVAPGIALCAKHVIDDNYGRLSKLSNGIVAPMASGITSHGVDLWRIRKITTIADNDVCILGLSRACALPPTQLLHQAYITTRLPHVGEKLLIAGFRASQSDFTIFDNQRSEVTGEVLLCSGIVTKCYPNGRDRCMLPWPTLEVECPSWGGMSGGPVFDQHGRLVGVLTSSFDGERGPSYVSLLWAALTAEFEGGWPAPMFKSKSCLLDLDKRLCQIDRREAIRLIRDTESNTVITEYEIWH